MVVATTVHCSSTFLQTVFPIFSKSLSDLYAFEVMVVAITLLFSNVIFAHVFFFNFVLEKFSSPMFPRRGSCTH